MLKIIRRFGTYQRNFFQVSPLFPDKDQLVYRPKIEEVTTVINQGRHIYGRKLNKIVNSLKKKNIQSSKEQKVDQQLKKQQLWEQIYSNVYMDPDTNTPIGLMFDDFILNYKAKQGRKYEEEYKKRMKKLLSQMSAMDEGELLTMSQSLISNSEKNNNYEKAKAQIFQNLREEVKKLRNDKQACLLLFDQYFDKSQSEFALSAIKDNNTEQLKGLLKEQKVDEIAGQIGANQFKQELLQYQVLKSKYSPETAKDNTNLEGFYESHITDSDFSHDERLIGQKFNRDKTGFEIYDTQQSIQDKVLTDQIKRSYLRKQEEDQSQQGGKENLSEFFQVRQFFQNDLNLTEFELNRKAQQINQNLKNNITFEKIQEQLDYLLLNAPEFVKSKAKDPENQFKKFDSHFIGYQDSLLWQNFENTFPVVFPQIKGSIKQSVELTDSSSYMKNLQPLTVEKEVVKESKIKNVVQLYDELKKPKNVQFFTHYLQNVFRSNREAINQGLESLTYGQVPYCNFIPKNAIISEVESEDDIAQDENEQQQEDAENQQKEVVNLEAQIMKEYQEASLLSYMGMGMRKTCKCQTVIKKGCGLVTINGKNLIHYFPHPYHRRTALYPIELAQLSCLIDVDILIRGSSTSAQSEAISVALSRAIVKMCPSLKKHFRQLYLTRSDSRQVERKKIGLYKARKKFPYSRR